MILATGTKDVEIELPDLRDAVRRGLIRYCPICDGFEARDRKVGVIGHGARGLGEAMFMARTYGADVTVLTFGRELTVTGEQEECARRLGSKSSGRRSFPFRSRPTGLTR